MGAVVACEQLIYCLVECTHPKRQYCDVQDEKMHHYITSIFDFLLSFSI